MTPPPAVYSGQSAIREQLVGRALAIEAWILVFWLVSVCDHGLSQVLGVSVEPSYLLACCSQAWLTFLRKVSLWELSVPKLRT